MKHALSAAYPRINLPLVRVQPVTVSFAAHKKRIKQALRDLGMSRVGLAMMESRHLPRVIHKSEHLGGVMYGHSKDGNAMLVATNKRVIYLDKKPLFIDMDEISYNVISGINTTSAGLDTIVTLHTRIKDYSIRGFNKNCAQIFTRFIEQHCLGQSQALTASQ